MRKHLRKAAEAGDPDAMYRLGNAYKDGTGQCKPRGVATGSSGRKNGFVTPEQRQQQGAALYQQAVVFTLGRV